MTLRLRQFRDFPGAPRRMVSPVVTFVNIAPLGGITIGAGATLIIKQDAAGINPPTSDNWNIGVNNIFSWHIIAQGATDELGVTLQIEVSPDGFGFLFWKNFAIDGSGFPDFKRDVEVPGWQCRVSLINASTVDDTVVNGMIRLQSK